MVCGTTDQDRVFHPFVLAICKGETSEDFQFMFEALHKEDVQWKLSILCADACEAITKGSRAIFGEPSVRIICYFHVLQNF